MTVNMYFAFVKSTYCHVVLLCTLLYKTIFVQKINHSYIGMSV